jgi:hypothetical protein
MNLFILSLDPKQIAEYMFDNHVHKILLEAVQMLVIAKRVVDPHDPTNAALTYGMSHKNHPVSVWCRESRANYLWTLELVDALHDEWRFRHGHQKVHKSYVVARHLRRHVPLEEAFPSKGRTPFALVMPDAYKSSDGDAVASYRNYYMSPDKQRISRWKKTRPAPAWYNRTPVEYAL